MHRPEPYFNVAAQVIKQAEQNTGNTVIVTKFQLRELLA